VAFFCHWNGFVRGDNGHNLPPTLNANVSKQFGCGNGHPFAPKEDRGQDPIINVALAYGFADIALRHKRQRI